MIILFKLQTYLGSGGGKRSIQHGVVGDLHGEIRVVNERPGASHSTRLVFVVEGLQMGVAEQAAVPEVVAAVEGTRRGRWGRCWRQRPRRGRPEVGSTPGLLGAVVFHLEGVQHADGGVELEVAAAGACRCVNTVAERRQHAAEGRGGLWSHDPFLLQSHVVHPCTLVQLARRTPRWNKTQCSVITIFQSLQLYN